MGRRMRSAAGMVLLLGTALLATAPPAAATSVVVKNGYLTLSDGTQLRYTLTLPSASGRVPIIMEYDPYAAGVTSDTDFASAGYGFLWVNFRGTGCSTGTFYPLRSEIWGRDGGEVINWASHQPWSDGNLGMFGYSFTGTSQLATAEYAGPALKAIMPWNVFPDSYRSLVYPGGIFNSWILAWVNGGRQLVLGAPNLEQTPGDPQCAVGEAEQTPTNTSGGADVARHPFMDSFWATQPLTRMGRIHIPVLGCVTWQDTTVHSYAFDDYRLLDPRRTWVFAGDGGHNDCPISHGVVLSFLNHYLKQERNGWLRTPHITLAHELPAEPPSEGMAPPNGARWTSSFPTWSAMDRAILPLTLHLRAGGLLSPRPPMPGEVSSDAYDYGGPTNETPKDWGGSVSFWNNPAVPGRTVTYTTPRLTRDVEFLGSGSANLWLATGAPAGDVQITLSEIRPDGQEEYVESGWLRLRDRRLDPRLSTTLRPVPTFTQQDMQLLTPLTPVRARIQMLPFDHVFRAGSAIRLTLDTPGGYFAIDPSGPQMTLFHTRTMDSTLVLGRVAGAVAHAPLPSCARLLNQPCRPVSGTTPGGALTLPVTASPSPPGGRR